MTGLPTYLPISTLFDKNAQKMSLGSNVGYVSFRENLVIMLSFSDENKVGNLDPCKVLQL